MQNYTAPIGFSFDPDSGLYYEMKEGKDYATGKHGQWVAWFYPETGELNKVFYETPEKSGGKSRSVTVNESDFIPRKNFFTAGNIFMLICAAISVFFIVVGFILPGTFAESMGVTVLTSETMEVMPGEFSDVMVFDMGSIGGMWLSIFLNFMAIAFPAVFVYFFIFRRYCNFLQEKYDYNLTGKPAKFGVICCSLMVVLMAFKINPDFIGVAEKLPDSLSPEMADSLVLIIMLIIVATPAVLIATLKGLFVIKNPLYVAINIPVTYIFCLASIIAIAMYLLFRLIVMMFGGLIGAAVFGLGGRRPLTEAERIERSNYVTVYRE